MKKYSFILCIALVAFVVASCGLKGNHTSSGRAYELLVVVDHGVWDRAAGRALHDALDADMPGLPQSEPSFRIMYTSPKDYDSTLKLIRNIVIVCGREQKDDCRLLYPCGNEPSDYVPGRETQ